MKTVVITGANRGIGLALCAHYQALGKTVYALCRQASTQLKSLNVNLVEGIDVSDEQLGSLLSQKLAGITIDLLINNAGILRDESLENFSPNQIREQFEVNTLAPLKVVVALQSQLNSAAKVVMITSRMGSIEDNTSGGRYGYRMSKAALNIASKSLSIDLATKNIAVAIIHPGYVQTEMVNGNGLVTAAVAATNIAARIEATNLSNSGTFWHAEGQVLPW